MSLALIEEEVRRFLSTKEPEVLCIKGKWGVGKTYGWMKFLDQANTGNSLALDRYSYVSLFGLNSLDDLRFAIFERTVSGQDIGKGADATTFQKLVNKGSDIARKFRPIADGLAAAFNRKGVSDILARSAFLSVQKQLICLDDLERAGDGLNVRDVLGLVSFLRIERQCKMVLLLNDQEFSEEKEQKEFNRQLEKVADVTVLFDPTVEEASEIAFREDDDLISLLRPRVIELGITNIRVIKKIETLARRLAEILHGFDNGVLKQAMSTLVLAAWSVYQPDNAPPMEFIKKYNQITDAMRDTDKEEDEAIAKWRQLLTDYPFSHADPFDLIIMSGASRGYFLHEPLRQEATALQRQYQHTSRDTIFTRAWDELYHGSLNTEDDDFLDELYRGAIAEAEFISALNINSAIYLLRENGRERQADEVIEKWFSVHTGEGLEFFNIANHHFSQDDRIDGGFKAAFEDRRSGYQDDRDPYEVLVEIGRSENWSEADIALMAMQSADDFEGMFEELRGRDVRKSIETILRLGRIDLDGSKEIKAASHEALRRIAKKSPLRARKVARFGVELNPPKESGAATDPA
ncbi:hypothetical protein [Roseibium salinum]|uniref:KAP NTPase domain-containing protein n=2 Tax=Roseibium salinum TaxID=1604349 RepID=A0ABT3R7R5_9HYPH|nr:hypothetical protein [Roseibium sp. DSM 29163]MCX2725146.1 hypothetical protein [Roseibium sp. DSM 29163]